MTFIKLTLFRRLHADKAPTIYVNFSRVQCLERQGEGTRIQFNLGEPSLIVKESVEDIFELIKPTTKLRVLSS